MIPSTWPTREGRRSNDGQGIQRPNQRGNVRSVSRRPGLLEDAEEIAIKRVLAWQITEAMKAQGLTKTAMAALMRTDRRQLDRLLDPNNPSVTLSTLRRAASAVGRKLRVELT